MDATAIKTEMQKKAAARAARQAAKRAAFALAHPELAAFWAASCSASVEAAYVSGNFTVIVAEEA